jgi:hypothetical protein
MGRMPWATYLWPGLPQLGKHGSWSSLAVAVGFAALVNAALVGSLVWSELLTPPVRMITWLAVTVLWAGSALVSLRGRAEPAAKPAGTEDAYREALDHYLKGNWFEAECVLGGLLRQDPRDLEARLLLATLLRHTGRIEEARQQLDRLERFEGSGKWALEIHRERQGLDEARRQRTREATPNNHVEASDPPAQPEAAA